jgi:hypothetical protein
MNLFKENPQPDTEIIYLMHSDAQENTNIAFSIDKYEPNKYISGDPVIIVEESLPKVDLPANKDIGYDIAKLRNNISVNSRRGNAQYMYYTDNKVVDYISESSQDMLKLNMFKISGLADNTFILLYQGENKYDQPFVYNPARGVMLNKNIIKMGYVVTVTINE